LRVRDEGDEGGAERTCVASGYKGPPEAMIRFALAESGEVVPDLKRKLPGRGVWTQLNSAVVARAVKKQAFSRGFRTKANAAPDLAQMVGSLLERDALQFLSIVNKAGLVVAGAAKVDAAIRGGAVVGLIHAADAAPDGVAKLDRVVRGRFGEAGESVARINLFQSSQLDLALGRTNVIHAALSAGKASDAFLMRARRLAQYRANEPTAALVEVGEIGAPVEDEPVEDEAETND
jgi:predicted RNA-binding protein YlxR (DUF448 family)